MKLLHFALALLFAIPFLSLCWPAERDRMARALVNLRNVFGTTYLAALIAVAAALVLVQARLEPLAGAGAFVLLWACFRAHHDAGEDPALNEVDAAYNANPQGTGDIRIGVEEAGIQPGYSHLRERHTVALGAGYVPGALSDL